MGTFKAPPRGVSRAHRFSMASSTRIRYSRGLRMTDAIFTTKDCRYGPMKYLTTDIGVGQMLTLFGEYFEGEVAIFRRMLRPGDTVVSAGGNIGVHLIP